MADLLLELLSEEIPSRMQLQAAADLKKLTVAGFLKFGLSFESIGAFATPRRLTLTVTGLATQTQSIKEERRGPRVGAPDIALEGFMRSLGIKRSELFKRLEKKGEFFFAQVESPSHSAAHVISETVSSSIINFPWRKSMRWGNGNLKWIRPLHSIVCILTDSGRHQIVPLEVDGVISGNTSYGHRFMAPEGFEVHSFEDYERKLKSAKVILDSEKRSEIIWNQATNLAFAQGLEVVKDQELLDEISGLVEWPVPLLGKIDNKFLNLPKEVLQVSMREHQKFFSVIEPTSSKICSYVAVANIETQDNGEAIIRSNGRVLKARLTDAEFFWKNDLDFIKHKGFKGMREKLEEVTFHYKLGSQSARVSRLVQLAEKMAEIIGVDPEESKVAASICKLDLVTEMVYEFPELQGTMGYYYAIQDGYSEVVAAVCREHYAPLGPSDKVPKTKLSILVSLVDKLDLLCSFWSINEKPTGNKDPYALRRSGIGIIRTLLENRIRIPISVLLKLSDLSFDVADLQNFIFDRFRVYLKERGFRSDVVAACIKVASENTDLINLHDRVEAIQKFIKSNDGKNLIQGYKRALNILRAEEERDACLYNAKPEAKLMQDQSEKLLYNHLKDVETQFLDEPVKLNFDAIIKDLALLRGPIDKFFDQVKINAENEIIRKNRLCLLNQLKIIMHEVAIFSEIENDT